METGKEREGKKRQGKYMTDLHISGQTDKQEVLFTRNQIERQRQTDKQMLDRHIDIFKDIQIDI